LIVGINAYYYVYGYNVFSSLHNFFSNHPEINIDLEKQEKSPPLPLTSGGGGGGPNLLDTLGSDLYSGKQVFNIPGNNYTYNDAKSICQAYGGTLANYSQIEKAYEKGAEWCNYGWSDGQMALFPTQKNTWNQLQKIKGHENDCGRPGINGGYMANPDIKYGVNCFAGKPSINKEEENLMKNASPYPKTEKDLLEEKQVDYWKNHLSDLILSPFNHDTWSKM
jgi:hypothetical protein